MCPLFPLFRCSSGGLIPFASFYTIRHWSLSLKRLDPSSTKAPISGIRQSGEICQAFYTEAFHVVLPCVRWDDVFRSSWTPLPCASTRCLELHFCAYSRFCDGLLHVSRLLGLTLRPSAPVFRCHRENFDTLEVGTCAGSRAWYLSFVFPIDFFVKRSV